MKAVKPVYLFFIALAPVIAVLAFAFRGERAFVAAETPSDRDLPPAQIRGVDPNRKTETADKLRDLLRSENLAVDSAELSSGRSENIRVRLLKSKPAGTGVLAAEGYSAEFALLSRVKGTAGIRIQRSVELSPTQILAVSVDAAGRVVWWSVQPDPLLVRTEVPDDFGNLSGGSKLLESADFLTSVPDDERVAEIRFYHPSWDGNSYALSLIGSIAL